MSRLWCAVYLTGALCFATCYGSSGDRSVEFRSCLVGCVTANCSSAESSELSLSLRLLAWDCPSNCQYHCMRIVTDQDVKLGRPIRQFYGKWPFVRVFGIQEPASAIFSVLNGVTLAIGYYRFCHQVSPEYRYHSVLRIQFWVNIHTWTWSAIFHSRDLPWTEKMDYFSAASLIIIGLVVQFMRITGAEAVRWHLLYSMVCSVLFVLHVSYLSLYKFDYGYNMAASVGAGVVYTCVWLAWSIKNRRRRPYVWKCASVVIATSCLLALELFDFPPALWTFDAHSLWHCATIPLPLLWYSFLTDDANFEVQRIQKTV